MRTECCGMGANVQCTDCPKNWWLGLPAPRETAPTTDQIAAAITRQFRDEMNGKLVDRIAEFVRGMS